MHIPTATTMARRHHGSTKAQAPQRHGSLICIRMTISNNHIPKADRCINAAVPDIPGTEVQAPATAKCHGASGSRGSASGRNLPTTEQAAAMPIKGILSPWQAFRHINQKQQRRHNSSICLGRVQHQCQGTTCQSWTLQPQSSLSTAARSKAYKYHQQSAMRCKQQSILPKTFREGKQ